MAQAAGKDESQLSRAGTPAEFRKALVAQTNRNRPSWGMAGALSARNVHVRLTRKATTPPATQPKKVAAAAGAPRRCRLMASAKSVAVASALVRAYLPKAASKNLADAGMRRPMLGRARLT